MRFALLLLAAAGALPSAALAADPVAGATKFGQSCSSCHSVASTAAVDRGRNSPSKIDNAIANISQMSFLASLSAPDKDDIAAFLGNSPSSLGFAQTTVGATSAVSVVTVRASDFGPLGAIAPSASGDFVVQGGSCATSLAASASCTIGVAFKPTAAGSRTGTLSIANDALATPVTIALSGTGAAAAVATLSLSATHLAFGDQVVASAGPAQTVTVTNTGAAALAFSAISLSGSAPGDFALGGTCAVATAVPPGGHCTVTAVFTPAATGARAATLALASNASNGSASVALAGTGVATGTPAVTLGASALDFGSVAVGATSATKTVSLKNSGSAVLAIQAIAAAAPFAETDDCATTLAAAASCTISVTFKPTAASAASGSLTVASNAAGSPAAVALAGTGVATASAVLQWSSAAPIDFGIAAVGADAAAQTLTLTNTGSGTADIGTLAIAGANAADFRVDTSSTCAAASTLAAGASCDVVLGFVPTAVGARAATLAVTSGNASVPAAVALAGTGSAPPAPALALSATALDFVAPAGGSAPAQSLTLTNSGNADLHVAAVGVDDARFTLSPASANGCATAPFTLAAGASCELQVGWAGASTDAAESATLTVTGDMQPASASVALQAEGAAATPSNAGGGGCTLAANTRAVDPVLLLMAALAGAVAWRRRRRAD